MTNETSNDEIDYDKLIEYELSQLDDENYLEEDMEENNVLENNINEIDSIDVVLNKIFETHEDFYKKCFNNAVGDDSNGDDDVIINEYRNIDKVNEKTKHILSYYNLTYEQFVETISNIKEDFENEIDINESNEEDGLKTDIDNSNTSLKALIDHDKIMQEINEKKWSEYEKFYREFDERCQSARSISQKELQQEAFLAKCKRQERQENLDQQLKLLEKKLSTDEEENKVRLMEIEMEIQKEKEILVNLQNENKELINSKCHKAAIIIQKNFRRYRVRKRIGSQIDEARNNAKRKIFNTKLIINEKKAQKQKAAELRKYRKEKDKEKAKMKEDKMNKLNTDVLNSEDLLNVYDITFSESSTKDKSGNNTTKSKINKNLSKINIINNNLEKSIKTEIEDNNKISSNLNSSKVIGENFEKLKIIDEGHCTQSKNKIEFQEQQMENSDFNSEREDLNNLLAMQSNNNNSNLFESKFVSISPESVNILNENTLNIFEDDKEINHSGVCILSENSDEVVSSETEIPDLYESNGDNINDINVLNNNFVNKLELNEIINNVSKHMTIANEVENMGKNYSENDKTNINQEPCVENKLVNGSSSDKAEDLINNPSLKITENDTIDNTFDKSKENIEIQANEYYVSDKNILSPKNTDPDAISKLKEQSCNDIALIKGDLISLCKENIKQLDNITPENTCVNHNENSSKNNDVISILTTNIKMSDKRHNILVYDQNSQHDVNQIPTTNNNENLSSNTYQSLNENENSSLLSISEDKIKEIFQSNLKIIPICLEWMHQILVDKNCKGSSIENEVESELLIPAIPKHFCKNSNFDFSLSNCSANSVIMVPDENSNTCKSLSITKSQIDSISNMKKSFPSLEHLVLNETSMNYFHMDDLPESIRYINIDQNQIEWVYFGQLMETNLTILSCSSNELTDLPVNAFKNCRNIIDINFSNNNFVNIDSIFRGNITLTKLCSLNLNNNLLSSLDNIDKYCPNLTHLSVSRNHIKNWPYCNKFPHLIYCDISHNSLTSIKAWSNTPLLINLNLSYNLITDLESFQYSWMPSLSVLILDSNKLNSIPELSFLSLQKISIQRNFLSDSINFESLFQLCPLLSNINLKDNPEFQSDPTRCLKTRRSDTNKEVICPDGDFASACYDFSDSIQQKSDRFNNLLKSSKDLELNYKHQIHYYRFVKEMVEDFSFWMEETLFCNNSKNKKYEKIHYDSAIKIQSVWRGYKTRKWYRSILSYIRFDLEASFDELGLIDLSEYEKNDLINNYDIQKMQTNTKAWIEPVNDLEDNHLKKKSNVPIDSDNDEIIIAGNDSTYRSNSTSMLSRKEIEIMKEWGFEDPNSALWMLQRAKKFHKKPIKNPKRHLISQAQKPPLPSSKPVDVNCHKTAHSLQKISMNVAPINTITIQPPEYVQHANYKSKIDQWLNDNNFMPNISSALSSDKRIFLPAIESDNQFKKVSSNVSRPKSTSTKLPAINFVP